MVMDGGGTIAEMAVVAPKLAQITPCGGCRQRISEFAQENTVIHLCSDEGITDSVTIGQLLPRAFAKESYD